MQVAEVKVPTKVADGAAEEAIAPATVPEKGARKGLPRPLIFALLGIVALVAGVFAFRWWQYSSVREETDNALLAGHVHPVSARVNGTVKALLVEDNQLVKAGQILLRLDPADYQVRLQQARAALETARRQALTSQANIRLAQSQAGAQRTGATGGASAARSSILAAQSAVAEARAGIPSAKAQLAQAAANLERARLDFTRIQALAKEGAIAQQQLDATRATYQVAVASRDAANEAIRQAEARLAQANQGVENARAGLVQAQGTVQSAAAAGVQAQVREAEYATARATVAQAEATLKDAQLQLSYTNIFAASAGRVGRRTVEIGARVQPGQQLLAIVESRVWIVANFKETQLADMRPGQPVEVKLDALGSRTFEGRVDSLSPASGAQFALLPPDNATGNFTKVVQRVPVKIVLDASSVRGYESLLAPGLSAVVSVRVR